MEKNDKGQHLKRDIVIGVISTLTVIGIAVVIVSFWMQYERQKREKQSDDFCCPDLVRLLWQSSNLSMNPCRDFYEYTCYSWDRSQQSTFLETLLLNEVSIPVFTSSTIPTARAIAGFYIDCVRESLFNTTVIQSAVEALLDALKPPLMPMPRDMLTCVLRMSLTYHLRPGIILHNRTFMLTAMNWMRWRNPVRLAVWNEGLDAFNRITRNVISLDNAAQLAREAFIVNRPEFLTVRVADLSQALSVF